MEAKTSNTTEAENTRDARRKLFLLAVENAKKVLKPGDRIRVSKCPGTKRWVTFAGWDGHWIVSKSGINDYSPCVIDMLNGKPVDFKTEENPKPLSSPFDLLMDQIEAMRNRARKYAEEEERDLNFDSAHRNRSVEGTLNELLRLGRAFADRANTGA